MKKSTYISRWWHKQEEIEFTKNLISLKEAQVTNTNKEIEELKNKLEKLEKEIFGVRLDAIGKTDPVEEYIKGE